MNMINRKERDKVLTELMGHCWHNYIKDEDTDRWDEHSACDKATFECSKCCHYQEDVLFRDYSGWAVKRESYWEFPDYCFLNFSTWQAFGTLWKFVHEQSWRNDYFSVTGDIFIENPIENMSLMDRFVDPNTFANTVYQYVLDRPFIMYNDMGSGI